MFLDKRLTFDTAKALTASGNLTDTIDLGSDRDLGSGQAMYWALQLDAAADAADGNETYSFALQTDDNSAFSSPVTIGTITVTRGDAIGTRYWIGMPQSNERHLRVVATLGGTTPSVTVTSYLTGLPPTAWQAYPAGISS